MNAAELLKNLPYGQYQALIGASLPPGTQTAFSDNNGAIYWSSQGFPETLAAEMLCSGSERMCCTEQGGIGQKELPSGTLYLAPISISSNLETVYLLAHIPSPQDAGHTRDFLAALVQAVTREWNLNNELDEMAAELANRYEELNLVYHTEDQIGLVAEGQEALRMLVQNCCTYLDMDVAAFIVPEKKMLVMATAEQQPEKLVFDELVPQLASQISARGMIGGKPIVINDTAEAQEFGLDPDLGYRLAVAPVLDGKDRVNGSLLLMRDSKKLRFSNGDKNLLLVMARKVGKIIQIGYDIDTGLMNREGYEYTLASMFADVTKNQREHSLLHINIDQLHITNDTIGHEAGDLIIKSVAALLRSAVRDSDVIARLGGNEFGILLWRCPHEKATNIAEKLRESVVELMIPIHDRTLSATVSIGIAPFDSLAESGVGAGGAAELACSTAKELGRNRVHSYHHSDTGLIRRHDEMQVIGMIQTALKEDRFQLYGQLIEPVAGPNSRLHFEVLLRMAGDDGEIVSPARFMPAAERYQRMPDIDRWVVRNTIEFLNAYAEELATTLELISVNLSGQALNEPGFVEFLEERLAELTLPLDCICFEITETTAVQNLDFAREFMNELRQRGCRFALDDFGAGLSSFRYLRSLPVDFLKIDGDLVKVINHDPISASMVASVQQIAEAMQLETIAEFVENDTVRGQLQHMGVTYVQGYGVAKPKPLIEFVDAIPKLHEVSAK